MKVLKRNIVVITVLLFVCAAVYLNWSYNNGRENTAVGAESAVESIGAAEETAGEGNETALYYKEDEGVSEMEEYFASVRLKRSEARAAATETLMTLTKAENAAQEVIDSSLADIARMADWSLQEAELENLIMAKGFSECVVYISDGGISVTVPADQEGLSAASVAKITDIVTGNTDFSADKLKIIEIK